MINQKRRLFITQSTAIAASTVLTACGGGGGTASPAVASTLSTVPLPVPPVVPVPEPTPTPDLTISALAGVPIAGAVFSLSAVAAQPAAPYCLGYAFKRGDVPAGLTVVADKGSFQVTKKNAWPDGSLKFAVLAGLVDLPAGVPITVNLRTSGVELEASALGTERLRASGAVAEIGCDTFGTVRWSGTDWDTPFKTWISGPAMSSWIYRKQVGSDAHLVGWLEVRLWASGAVEVLPWIENGYMRVAAPSNKMAKYTFSFGNSLRVATPIDLKHHQRTVLIDGPALSYWLAADPQVTPRHDTAYLQATELVPTYEGQVSDTAPAIAALVSRYKPLQIGNLIFDGDSMASSGYQEPIGLLPQHDVLYLTSSSAAAYAAVIRNGFGAGRYGIHYRDENTNRPPRFSKYPTLNIANGQGFKDNGGSTTNSYMPAGTGGSAPTWDVAHSPSVGFAAYLITGRYYFMEQVQFAATTNYLGNGSSNGLRTNSKGLVQTATNAWQTRSCAWDWRAKVQALCVTPDDDSELRAEFIASVEANIEHFHGRYVAKPNNPYGWIKPGEVYAGGTRMGAPWQQDFVTAAFGYSISMGLPISSTAEAKLRAFFAWKAKSVIMRLGTKEGFWFINAVPYNMAISPSANPDYDNGTGPWYDSDLAVYNATYATPPAWLGKIDNMLAASILPGERAYWGNLLPAIAYAVRHGVAGASEAYGRVRGASNFPALRAAMNLSPVWSVQPGVYVPAAPVLAPVPAPLQEQAGDPAWMTGSGLHEWIEIPGTAGAGGSAVDAYSGFAFNEQTNEIIIAAAGGHFDSRDNRVVTMRISDNAPYWRSLHGASEQVLPDVPYYPDGLPSARHLYSSAHYVPQLNRVFLFGATTVYGKALSFPVVDAFNLANNTWDPAGTHASMPTGHVGAVTVRGSNDVWSTQLGRWSPASKTWTLPITRRTKDKIRTPIAHDSLRGQLFSLNWGDGWGYSTEAVYASRVPLNGTEQISVSFAPGAGLDSFMAEKPRYAAMDYDAPNDRFLFYSGVDGQARVYVIKPNDGNVWDISLLEVKGAARPQAPKGGVHSRFRYVPGLRGFLLMPNAKSNLFFIRTSA